MTDVAVEADPTVAPSGYPDCQSCRGYGYFNVIGSQTLQPGDRIACGNCLDRRQWEGLERTERRAWCVWTKTGRRPSRWHDSREKAELEAARLARKHPGKTFIVFEKLVNIRVPS